MSINNFIVDFEEIHREHGTDSISHIMNKYSDCLNYLKDFYFEYSKQLIDQADSQASSTHTTDEQLSTSAKSGINSILSKVMKQNPVDAADPFTEAFFYIYTAAALGHPRARM